MSTGKFVRQIGIATTIPMILAAGPLLGYWLGQGIDGRFATDPWGKVVLSLLGFGASVKQVITIIRRVIQETNKD